jgi:hypothetical protein
MIEVFIDRAIKRDGQAKHMFYGSEVLVTCSVRFGLDSPPRLPEGAKQQDKHINTYYRVRSTKIKIKKGHI